MATVQALVSLICDEVGLDGSASSSERAFALARLNSAYKELVGRMGLDDEVTVAVSADADTVDVSASVQTINHVAWRTSTAQTKLERASMDDVFDDRSDDYGETLASDRVPSRYSWSWPNVKLSPSPGADGTLVIWGHVTPDELVESGAAAGQEESPSMIPEHLQEAALARLAMVRCLEGLEGMEERAAYHRRLLGGDDGEGGAVRDLMQWRKRAGGRSRPKRGHDHWWTPSRIEVR